MTVPRFPIHPDPIRHWAAIAPQREAITDRRLGTRLSYADVDRATARWQTMLAAMGIGRGSRVGAVAGTRHELVSLFYACGRLGALLIPFNWRLPAAELAPVLSDARPQIIVGEGRFRQTVEQALASATSERRLPTPRWIDLDDEAPRLLAGFEPARQPGVDVAPDDPWLVLYTSGSTGRPKGAVLPHRQILYNAVATTTSWALGADDVAPLSTPLFHTGGWNVFATPLWLRGGRVVLVDGFRPDEFLDVLAEERCTVALTVPTQLVMLLESARWRGGHELADFRAFWVGGAPCPASVVARVRAAGYGLREGYGLTECGPNCFAITQEEADRTINVVGRPVAFLEMRVVADEGRDAEDDEPGELWLRGPQQFAGYLDAPERTAEAVTPDGWLRTGDLARRGADGAYAICGRRKEMFISGGENVFPGEVEAALADCPGVTEVVVIGVPDARWGEVGRAYVLRQTGRDVTMAEVIEHARQRLAGYKVPKSVVVLDELPRLGSGKPDRRALSRIGG